MLHAKQTERPRMEQSASSYRGSRASSPDRGRAHPPHGRFKTSESRVFISGPTGSGKTHIVQV